MSLFNGKTCKIVCYDKPIWFDYCLAHIFFRQFFWHQCVLTAADLPKGSTVVLVEHDELVPVEDVVRDCAEHGVRCHVVPRTTHGFEMLFPLACGRLVQFIRQGHGEPLKNDDGVSLFFHTARSSKLYGFFYTLCLQAMDSILRLFVMRGHSPFNLKVLSYVDDLWPGGRRSLSAMDLRSLAGLGGDDSDNNSENTEKMQGARPWFETGDDSEDNNIESTAKTQGASAQPSGTSLRTVSDDQSIKSAEKTQGACVQPKGIARRKKRRH